MASIRSPINLAPPGTERRWRLERAGRRMRLASRIDVPLLSLARLLMAVARYL